MSGDESQNVTYYDHLANAYELFFDDLAANMAAEGEWLATLLRSHGVRTVLDASCGTGRQAIPLQEQGFAVTAADPSAPMLRQAASLSADRAVELPLIRAGFTELPEKLDARFDAVIALGNGLAHAESLDDIGASLRALRACCQDHAVCLVGIKDFARLRERRSRFHGHGIVDRPEGRTLMFEAWDYQDPILTCTTFLLNAALSGSGWDVQTESTCEYMMEQQQLAELAHAAGFSDFCRLHHSGEAIFLMRPRIADEDSKVAVLK